MQINWVYEEAYRRHIFTAECEDENIAIALEAHVYGWLAACENKGAVKTLELRRRCQETQVRDRTRMYYGHSMRGTYKYLVTLHFKTDGEAVAFKLFIS
jgi:hypothetical protein